MTPLRLLLIEDSEDDAMLLVRELRQGGFDPDFARIETPQALESALDAKAWDAVVADYSLPAFTGLDALRIIRERMLDLPFILVSGVIGEEKAVEAMKAGAHDFIMKGHYQRLAPALKRELGDAAVRRERRQAEDALRLAHAELERRVAERTAELQAANDTLRDSRRAALNMMEDADTARRRAEEAGAELQRELTERKRAEEALRKSERHNEFLANILESASQPFAVGYPDGRLVLANTAYEQLTGYSGDELKTFDWAVTLTPPEWREIEQERLEELYPTGRPVRYEKEYVRKDGSRVPVELLVHIAADAEGKPEYYYAFVTDITERKRAEARIYRQNAVLKGINRIFETALSSGTEEELGEACLAVAEEVTGSRFGFIGEIGEDGLLHDIAISNPGWELCTMYDREGRRRPPGNFHIHGVYGRVLLDGKGFFTNDPASHPDSIGMPDGHPPLTAFLGVPLFNEGRTIGMIAVGNREGGYGHDELEVLTALAPAMLEAFQRLRAEEALRRAHDELEMRVADRTEELASAINILQEEIVERERAEERIRRLNRLYAVLSGTRHAIVLAADRESLFRDFCRIAVEDGGFLLSWVGLVEGESCQVRTVAAHGATGYLDDIRISAQEDMEGRGPTGVSIREGTYYICNDFQNDPCTTPWHERGRAHGIEASASIALKQHGRVIGALTLYADKKDFFDPQQVELLRQMGADVSFALDNLERAALLRESERKFRTLFEESKDVIYIMSPDGRFLDINSSAVELFGYQKEELLSLDVVGELYCDPTDRERFLQGLLAKGYVRDFEVCLRRKGGDQLHVLKTATAIRNDQGEISGYRGIIHDVTQRKRLELQLLQAQKMESIGLLAGGVAHDFNNLLTAISGYSQLIQDQFAPRDEMLKMCNEQVLGATERAVELTRNLLAFSRKQIMKPQPLRVNDIVTNLTKLLTRIIGEDIELGTTLTGRELTVLADGGQIDQVLINLATNARDAMPHGGQLQIRTERVVVDAESARRLELDEGAYALIFVSDSGHGMDSRTRERIFEPFFTTKETGKGTGLGLSIIYGIIKQHNGTITVASEPGKGATFTIYLPLVEEATDAVPTVAASAPPQGTETLLLAEDDAMVRKYMQQVLQMAGYDVIPARNGAEAVELFREHRDRIALVVCDVVMPKKNGKEVYDEVRDMAPHARFLFTSGYNDEIIHKKGILHENIELLVKPVSRGVLLEKLREMLDSHSVLKEESD
ncbi:MAG TPA: GAF domain-containing protein [Geobacteraceae bacterium]